MENQPSKTIFDHIREKLRSLGNHQSILDKSQANGLEFEDDWQHTFDAMSEAVWILDKDHTILRSNIAAEKHFQFSTKNIIGKQCWEIVHGTKEPVPECPVQKSKKTLKRESMEFEIGGRWFDVVVDPILDSQGAYSKAIHIVTDITENKLTHELLEKNQRLLTIAQRLSKTGGWEWDVKKQKMYWTDETYRIHDIEPGALETGSPEHITKSVECYRPQDQPFIMDAFNQCADEGLPYDLEFPFTSAKGRKMWIRTSAQPVVEDGAVRRVVGTMIDITDRKSAEKNVKDSENRIRNIFNSICDAVFLHPLLDQGFACFEDVNQMACERYGYTSEEFKKLKAPDITVKSDANSHSSREHRRKLRENERMTFEATHITKTGDEFPVEINSTVIDLSGRLMILAVVRDITERKQVELEREKLINKLKDALEEIKELRGFLPICVNCKKIRDDEGYWQQVEKYIMDRTDAQFSHSICPDCLKKLYPEFYGE